MKTITQRQSSPRRLLEMGKTESGIGRIGTDTIADLKQQLNEAVFLGRFIGAISASLDPNDICAIASRWLYDFVPYLRIVFALSPDLGVKTLVYSPGTAKESELDPSTTDKLPGYIPEEFKDSRNLSMVSLFDGGVRCRRYSLELPEKMGYILIYFEERNTGSFSASFLNNVVENFSHALRNALEHNKVKELAMRDSLTGLFNRRVFDEMLNIEGKRLELMPLSLLIIDLDNFKQINDRFGHPAGDQVLARFGKILRENCRGSDLVARYGGEEFAVMLPATSSSIAFDIAQRLRVRLADTVFVFGDQQVRLTASIGIAYTAGTGKTAGDLVQRADQALYRAKKNGKNRTCVYATKPVEVVKKEPIRKKVCYARLHTD
ncbi:MAG: diguanylate [Geobacteraceae bacterium]|nr:MAG: diguanylate [Geobacteraceae bacterium]